MAGFSAKTVAESLKIFDTLNELTLLQTLEIN